jgi:pilus assembly protein CpaC
MQTQNQFLSTIINPPQREIHGGRKTMKNILAALLLTAASIGTVMAPGQMAYATDVNASEQVGDEAQLVRIGLHKSVVIKLPANARDVVVGDADVVDAVVRQKNVAYLFGKASGQTNVFFFDAEGNQILALDLEVAVDPLPLRKLLKRALPGTKITADTVNTHIILGGTAANTNEARIAADLAKKFAANADAGEVINSIKVAGEDQVMLKVKVVEIQRDVLKQFGVDFQALLRMGEVMFNIASVNPLNSTPLSPSGGYAARDNVGNLRFDTVIRAMEGDGLLRLLAEPNLSAVSGQEAKFHAGGEFPFQVCDSAATNGILRCEIDFKEFGVNVKFTPTVMSEGRINLKIFTEVSELTSVASGVQSVPSLNNRKAETVLEMPSGGTMMIAGLISQTTRQNLNGTPGLRKLPVLGNLFRSREFTSNETELVVLVTPYLVNPASAKSFVTPDKNFNPSTERQALFFGRLNKVYGTSGRAPSGDYNGNVGFIVE